MIDSILTTPLPQDNVSNSPNLTDTILPSMTSTPSEFPKSLVKESLEIQAIKPKFKELLIKLGKIVRYITLTLYSKPK